MKPSPWIIVLQRHQQNYDPGRGLHDVRIYLCRSVDSVRTLTLAACAQTWPMKRQRTLSSLTMCAGKEWKTPWESSAYAAGSLC
jgi:hypothetical protein